MTEKDSRKRLIDYIESLMESERLSGLSITPDPRGSGRHLFSHTGARGSAGEVGKGARRTIESMMEEGGTSLIIAIRSDDGVSIVLGGKPGK